MVRAALLAVVLGATSIALGGACSRAPRPVDAGPPIVLDVPPVPPVDTPRAPVTAEPRAPQKRIVTHLIDGELVIEEVVVDAGPALASIDPAAVPAPGDPAAHPGAPAPDTMPAFDAGPDPCRVAGDALTAARAAFDKDDHPRMLESGTLAARACPSDERYRAHVVDLFRTASRKDRQLAVTLGERLTEIAPSPAAFLALGDARDELNDLRGARDAYERGLDKFPDDKALARALEQIKKNLAVDGTFDARKNTRFTIRFEGGDRADLAETVLGHLDTAWRTIGDQLDIHPSSPITVIVYTGSQYADVGAGPDWSGGVFDGKIRIREGQIERSRGDLANTLYHEYTHALLGTLRTQVPTWFNEGLAMHFEPTPDGPERVRRHLAPIAADQLPSVAQLGGSFARVRDPAVVHVLYACAYDLVDELIRMRGVRSLASLVAALEKGMTFPEALDDVYDVDFALLDRKWRERRAQR